MGEGNGGGRPLSRARAGAVDQIVAGILEDMVGGRWIAGKSHRELAVMHAVSVDRVKDWAAEAGRTLRVLALVDREDMRARNAARLDVIVEQAMTKQAVVPSRDGDPIVVPQPDLRAAVSAIAEQGKLLGLNAPERTESRVSAEPTMQERYEAMDRPGRVRWLREQIAMLQGLLADEEAVTNNVLPATDDGHG